MSGSNDVPADRASGAYIFRPNCTLYTDHPEDACAQKIKQSGNNTRFSVVRGLQVQEVHVHTSQWSDVVFRLYERSSDLELQWTVGPIPIGNGVGREVIVRLSSDLQSNREFFTDSNARQMLRRVRDERPTWKLRLTEPVAANYYPITTEVLVRDDKRGVALALLTDRAQGSSSLADGQVEVMVRWRIKLCGVLRAFFLVLLSWF